MTPTDQICEDCGRSTHLFSYQCPMHLHGESDSFKRCCAACETAIPSGADRDADRYGNLYCGPECRADGLAELLARVQMDGGRPGATTDGGAV